MFIVDNVKVLDTQSTVVLDPPIESFLDMFVGPYPGLGLVLGLVLSEIVMVGFPDRDGGCQRVFLLVSLLHGWINEWHNALGRSGNAVPYN